MKEQLVNLLQVSPSIKTDKIQRKSKDNTYYENKINENQQFCGLSNSDVQSNLVRRFQNDSTENLQDFSENDEELFKVQQVINPLENTIPITNTSENKVANFEVRDPKEIPIDKTLIEIQDRINASLAEDIFQNNDSFNDCTFDTSFSEANRIGIDENMKVFLSMQEPTIDYQNHSNMSDLATFVEADYDSLQDTTIPLSVKSSEYTSCDDISSTLEGNGKSLKLVNTELMELCSDFNRHNSFDERPKIHTYMVRSDKKRASENNHTDNKNRDILIETKINTPYQIECIIPTSKDSMESSVMENENLDSSSESDESECVASEYEESDSNDSLDHNVCPKIN